MQAEISSSDWWKAAAAPANRRYALGIAVLSAFALLAPYVLGQLVPCAEFMEIEWAMVAFFCLAGIGLLNITFAFAPALESKLPSWLAGPLRRSLLVVLPFLIGGYAIWLAFSPFWYALLNDPELLCD